MAWCEGCGRPGVRWFGRRRGGNRGSGEPDSGLPTVRRARLREGPASRSLVGPCRPHSGASGHRASSRVRARRRRGGTANAERGAPSAPHVVLPRTMPGRVRGVAPHPVPARPIRRRDTRGIGSTPGSRPIAVQPQGSPEPGLCVPSGAGDVNRRALTASDRKPRPGPVGDEPPGSKPGRTPLRIPANPIGTRLCADRQVDATSPCGYSLGCTNRSFPNNSTTRGGLALQARRQSRISESRRW